MVWEIMTKGLSVGDDNFFSHVLFVSKCLLTYEVHDAILDRDVGADNVGYHLPPREVARAAICARLHLES